MSKSTLLIIAFALLVCALIGYAVLYSEPDNRTSESEAPAVRADSPKHSTGDKPTQTNTTLADRWAWEESQSADSADAVEQELPFTPQSVRDALQAVKVDENGDLVLDHDAMIALDEALERIYNRLDANATAELQNLIETALPGELGQETAELVNNYAQFLQAKEDFAQMHEGNAPDVPTLSSLDNDKALYQELKDLRAVYLGDTTAARLFNQSDASAEFMFESMRLELDDSLSPEQRDTLRVQLQQTLNEALDQDQP